MKIKKEKEIPEARVELVPLIDCVFLLLIFFMCAATMSKVDAPTSVKLPIAANAAEQKDPSRRGTVNVIPIDTKTPEGEISTEQRPFMVYGKLVSEEELTKVMEARLKEEPTLRLYLRADRNVKFSTIKRAMGACAAAGVQDVIFATYVRDLYSGGD